MSRALMSAAISLLLFSRMGVVLAQEATSGPGVSNSTLRDRLKETKHVGIAFDDKLGGYTLHIFTPEQHQGITESLAVWGKQVEEFERNRKTLIDRRNSAKTKEERKTSEDALRDLSQPPYPVRLGLKSREIEQIGGDYIEIREFDRGEGTTLIPLAKIVRVITWKQSPLLDVAAKVDEKRPPE